MKQVFNCLGLMSGTSMDGIDVAWVETDGQDFVKTGPFLTIPYTSEFRERLRSCLGEKGPASEVEKELTHLHAEAIETFLEQNALKAGDIDLIGFHGHTILHAPERRYTRQIGDGALLASLTKIPVVNDFRTADVRVGGQGAPLVPVYHQALASNLQKPLAVLNIGGVANVTWIGSDETLLAFDTGPGNALVDDWMRQHTGQAFDPEGQWANRGQINAEILNRLLDHPYFSKLPPKSLDRDAFSLAPLQGLSIEDGAATLTAFTAHAIGRALDYMPKNKRFLVTGGGRHNKTLMAMLQNVLGLPVDPVEAVGWNGDTLEAQAFAYLAVRSRLNLPLSFPGTTGIPMPLSGGQFHP